MLLCGVIEMAVLDYRLCKRKGIIVNGQINTEKQEKLKIKNMERSSEVASLISFFHGEGLELIIEGGNLKDKEGQPLNPRSILQAL